MSQLSQTGVAPVLIQSWSVEAPLTTVRSVAVKKKGIGTILFLVDNQLDKDVTITLDGILDRNDVSPLFHLPPVEGTVVAAGTTGILKVSDPWKYLVAEVVAVDGVGDLSIHAMSADEGRD